MTKTLNGKLTMDQKKAIIACNYGISQFGKFIDEDAYGDTASYKILERWISEVLEVDYRKDIYDNKALFELNKIEVVKRAFSQKFDKGWFVCDALKNVLYGICWNNGQEDKQILETEAKLKEIWNYFNSILPTKQEFTYELVGELNGEMLYRKVKNK